MFSFFIRVRLVPIRNVIMNGIMYFFLYPFFVASFIRWGIVPIRNPVNMVRVSLGYLFSDSNIILLNR